jgi:hypothetical protein
MNRFLIILFLCFACIYCNAQNRLGAIGQWRGHFDNHSVQNVVKGDYVYTATPFQIIKLDNNGVVNWLDKTTGLSDIDITHIAWDHNQNQLIVTYQNGNIDIIHGDQIYNLNAIQLSNLFSEKKINEIYVLENFALLATNFGIVSINLSKHEIKDTWFPNISQQPSITYGITIAHDSIYAATENGIWASPYIINGIQPNQWGRLSQYDGFNINNLIQKNNFIYGVSQTSVFQFPFTTPLLKLSSGTIQHIDSTANNLILNIQYPSYKGAVVQLNKDNTVTVLIDSSHLVNPIQTLFDNNHFWIADNSLGLLNKNNSTGTYQWSNLGGTKAAISGAMSISENNLVAPFDETQGYASFNGSSWNSFLQINNINLPVLYASTISKADNAYWFTSNNHLLHITNNNSVVETIKPNVLIGDYKEIHSDQNNAIWLIQDQQGILRQTNSIWNTISIPNSLQKNGLNKFIVNNQQQAWIIAPNNQGIYIYQSKDIYTTEMWKQLSTEQSNGNLPSTHVTSIASDKAGSIWVGTDNGIGIYNCGDIATEPCNAYLPIVNNNGFNGYLFQKETVRCITVDGANRKWIGTNNGAWLLSEDGLKIIEHFSKSNSPLTSDTVLQMVIAPNSGEVFFNTNHGMVSFRGAATEGNSIQQSIQIFPNPVPPNFNGLIAFKGLVENAIVKITDLTGKLLFQTTALGGQAVWNTRTKDGRKVATGIYLVFVRDISGNEKGVGKIVIADGY